MKKFILPIAIMIVILGHSCKPEVFQWRGDNRDGIYNETGLMDEWPEEGPEMLWMYEGLGRGYSAPVVTGERVYINGEEEGKSFLFALDLEGKLLWKVPNGEEFVGEGFSSTYPGARSAPTVVDDLVYSSSGKGRIGCFNAETGEEKWAVDIVKDLGGQLGYFGYSECLLIDGKKLFCFPGGKETNMAALNRITGESLWTSELVRDTFAYGSPILAELPERDVLFATSKHHLLTVDPENGDLLASFKLDSVKYDGEHCNTPIYNDGHLYFVAADPDGGLGTVCLEVPEDGKGLTEVWRNMKFRNNFGGFILLDGKLYTTLRGNKLASADASAGTLTDTVRAANGSLIYADEKFICYGWNGTVSLVKQGVEGLQAISEFKIKQGSGHHFSHPVLASGSMYIRRGNALMVYRIRQG